MDPPFSFEQIDAFSNEYIADLLTTNKALVSLDNRKNRLFATNLLYDGDLLAADDRHYVIHPQFSQLYILSNNELAAIAQKHNYSLTPQTTRFDTLRFLTAPTATIPSFTAPKKPDIIPQLSPYTGITPLISYVNVLPPLDRRSENYIPEGMALYQWMNRLYICGPLTYKYQTYIEAIMGTYWDSNQKCWSIPLTQSRAALIFMQRYTGENPLPTEDILQNATIPLIESIPTRIKGSYGVFRLISNPRVIYICGEDINARYKELLKLIPTIKESAYNRCLRAPVSSEEEVLDFPQQQAEIA